MGFWRLGFGALEYRVGVWEFTAWVWSLGFGVLELKVYGFGILGFGLEVFRV